MQRAAWASQQKCSLDGATNRPRAPFTIDNRERRSVALVWIQSAFQRRAQGRRAITAHVHDCHDAGVSTHCHVPSIACRPDVNEFTRQRIILNHAQDHSPDIVFLQKPFTSEKLTMTVRDALDSAQVFAGARTRRS